MIRVSIITVVLNDLPGLVRTFESIKMQNYTQFEWVVCDGGSGAETTIFLTALGDRVTWVSRSDKGIYDAMNHGVSMCSGDYVVFMNAGDTFFDGDTLANVVATLAQRKFDADILFGGAMLKFHNNMVYRSPRKAEHSIWHGLPANHQATFYRKVLLAQVPYDLQYHLCGDYYLAATLLNRGARPIYLDKPLSVFEVGGESYKRRKLLFLEPYRIQRDVLALPITYRLASMLKRLISTIGFILLSSPGVHKALQAFRLI